MSEPARGHMPAASSSWLETVARAGRAAGFVPADMPIAGAQTVSALRRSGRRAIEDNVVFAALAECDGWLRWTWHSDRSFHPLDGRGQSQQDNPLRVVAENKFRKLSSGDVPEFVRQLDAEICPRRGLYLWTGKAWRVARETSSRPCLLFLHDTFGNAEDAPFLHGATPRNRTLLAFSHSTLDASPLLTAVDLARALRLYSGPIDIIGYGRGGLVARWWRDLLATPAQRGRLALVGAPLDGALALSSSHLRTTLDEISNLARNGQTSAVFARWMTGVAGLVRILASKEIANDDARGLDGALSCVPGLAAQARERYNEELTRLQRLPAASPHDYAFVAAEALSSVPHADDNAGPRRSVGDLLVETASATQYPAGISYGASKVLQFGPHDGVHHWNYFEQSRTLDFLGDFLGTKLR